MGANNKAILIIIDGLGDLTPNSPLQTAKKKNLDRLAKEGYDPVYGARPLRRLIQSAIENPIAIRIINKTFVAGDKILINYDSQKEEFTFSKAPPQVQSSQNSDGEQIPSQPLINGTPTQNSIPNPPLTMGSDGTQMSPKA